VSGDPANEIVAYAEETDVDHIVVGSHGRSGLSRVLLGSTAEKVVRRSPVPVTVVKGDS
jgi:nucleotide-binding universal stress UspA family protein